MASLRITVRLLTAASRFSAEAVTLSDSGAKGPGAPPPIVAELFAMVGATLMADPHASDPDRAAVRALVAALSRRYGTLGGAIEALGEGRRRDPRIRLEAALAWHHAFQATLSSVDAVLRKNPVVAREIKHWLSNHDATAEEQISRYEHWLHEPLPDEMVPSPTLDDPPALTGPLAVVTARVLDDKPLGDILDGAALDDDTRAAAIALLAETDPLARAAGAIALRRFDEADEALRDAESADPGARTMLEGDRLFLDARFEEAVERYRAARVARDDARARLNLASALLHARTLGEPARLECVRLLEQMLAGAAPGGGPGGAPGTDLLPRSAAMLGAALLHSPSAERDIAVRRAIELLEGALAVIDRPAHPRRWAQVHASLGAAWSALPGGKRTENLQRAITCFDRALEVWTEASEPHAWALVQNLLGHAWEALPTGDRAAHLVRAISCYEGALRVHTRESHPAPWATLMNNLGNAWVQRPDGSKSANTRKAIDHHQKALEVWSREGRRGEWAATQNNLGNAWALLPGNDRERAEHLREAIVCYKAALEVRTRSTSPHEWAATQNNLGNAFLLLPDDGSGRPAREATECFEHALSVRTRVGSPVDWARSQANLGHAWARRTDGSVPEHLARAVHCYSEALGVLTKKDFPHHYELIRARLNEVQDRLDEAEMLS